MQLALCRTSSNLLGLNICTDGRCFLFDWQSKINSLSQPLCLLSKVGHMGAQEANYPSPCSVFVQKEFLGLKGSYKWQLVLHIQQPFFFGATCFSTVHCFVFISVAQRLTDNIVHITVEDLNQESKRQRHFTKRLLLLVFLLFQMLWNTSKFNKNWPKFTRPSYFLFTTKREFDFI